MRIEAYAVLALAASTALALPRMRTRDYELPNAPNHLLYSGDGPSLSDFYFPNISGHKYPDFYAPLFAVSMSDINTLKERIDDTHQWSEGYIQYKLQVVDDLKAASDLKAEPKPYKVGLQWQEKTWWHIGFASALHDGLVEYEKEHTGDELERWALRALTGAEIKRIDTKDVDEDYFRKMVRHYGDQPVVVRTKADATTLDKSRAYAVRSYKEDDDTLSLYTPGSDTEPARSVYGPYKDMFPQFEFLVRVDDPEWNKQS